jgi:hypothetical protein
MSSFDELTKARRELKTFCLSHVPSLMSLRSDFNFKLWPEDPKNLTDGNAHHLTTSATCWSSLFFDCPEPFQTPEFEQVENRPETFAEKALLRLDWKSEDSASIYCRCRALPMVVRCSARHALDDVIKGHVSRILAQLKQDPGRFAIGEADTHEERETWYPPNAYHTYWTLEILERIEKKFPSDYLDFSKSRGMHLDSKWQGMLLWARQKLGYQLGLHSADPQSSLLDSDQLAWSLAVFLRFDPTLNVDLESRDFLAQAFKCLFSTQVDGTWRHYKPLFHYTAVGNAYCYVFETFAALLQCALDDRAEAKAKTKMVRDLLLPYSDKLVELWRYADRTKLPLPDGKGFGWCSGHRINFPYPESWATASVFSYTQALRQLIGIWCREEALKSLGTRPAKFKPEKASYEMASRGKTWGNPQTAVSERLHTLFVNPVRMHEHSDELEPDSQPVEKRYARSAILFGPPGGSKTTLVRLLADAADWQYVELHASHFVAEGLTQVQKTADRIFSQLLELDHAVVLFDEIDELVREREMEEDAFGRFLTTSMLPKLAELWEARKILYFVATNHINYFDSAIVRSNRFDALILVSPPSFEAKVEKLNKLVTDTHGLEEPQWQVTKQDVQDKIALIREQLDAIRNLQRAAAVPETIEIREARWREEKLDASLTLAKFALLRYDELDELAFHLASALRAAPTGPPTISVGLLESALLEISDSEWRKNKAYADYLRDLRSERRDYQMLNVWEADCDPAISKRGDPVDLVPGLKKGNGKYWLPKPTDSPTDIEIPGFVLQPNPPGRVRIEDKK